MSNDNNASLSAWLDSEEHSDELIELLKQDDELAGTMSRYQLIGDVMRGEAGSSINIDISSKVSAALESEPVILAPKAAEVTATADTSGQNVVSLFRQVAQFAMAATVTGVMILGVQQYNANQVESNPDATTPAFTTVPIAGAAAPVSFVQDTQAEQKQETVIEQRRRINAFLTDHQQQLRLNAIADENTNKEVEQSESQNNQ